MKGRSAGPAGVKKHSKKRTAPSGDDGDVNQDVGGEQSKEPPAKKAKKTKSVTSGAGMEDGVSSPDIVKSLTKEPSKKKTKGVKQKPNDTFKDSSNKGSKKKRKDKMDIEKMETESTMQRNLDAPPKKKKIKAKNVTVSGETKVKKISKKKGAGDSKGIAKEDAKSLKKGKKKKKEKNGVSKDPNNNFVNGDSLKKSKKVKGTNVSILSDGELKPKKKKQKAKSEVDASKIKKSKSKKKKKKQEMNISQNGDHPKTKGTKKLKKKTKVNEKST